eukprot:3635790-Pyramimonas_sp.AAC.1
MGDFGWPVSLASAPAPVWASDGLQRTRGGGPCAVALSTSANACLSSQGIWWAPVPLGLAVSGITLTFAFGVLLALATQALRCSFYA